MNTRKPNILKIAENKVKDLRKNEKAPQVKRNTQQKIKLLQSIT